MGTRLGTSRDLLFSPSSAKVGDVAKHLLSGLSKIVRQPTVNALVKGLPKDERISMTSDVLTTLPLGNMLELIHVRSGSMEPNERTALVATVLETVSKAERAQRWRSQDSSLQTSARDDAHYAQPAAHARRKTPPRESH